MKCFYEWSISRAWDIINLISAFGFWTTKSINFDSTSDLLEIKMKRKRKFFAIEWWKPHSNISIRSIDFGRCKRFLNEIQECMNRANNNRLLFTLFHLLQIRLVCLPRAIVHYSVSITTNFKSIFAKMMLFLACVKKYI